MRKLFFTCLFLLSMGMLFAHDEKVMARNIEESPLSEIWMELLKTKDNSDAHKALLEEFQTQLEKTSSASVIEYQNKGIILINKIICLSEELKSATPEKHEALEMEITELLFEYLSFENSVSEYKAEKLLKLNLAHFFILAIFIITTVVFSFSSSNARIREKKARSFNKQIMQIQETERKRISNDLHDTITQDIRTSLIFVRELQAKSENASEEIKVLLEKINALETQNLKNIRNIIHNLTPPEIESANFRQLIAEYCANVTEMYSIPCICYTEPSELFNKLTSFQKLNLFRIIQESITNSVKHSGASEISIIARPDTNSTGKLVFFISDNGSGFDPENISFSDKTTEDITAQSTHLGLSGLKNRARLLNADLKISSDEETGTEIKLVLEV